MFVLRLFCSLSEYVCQIVMRFGQEGETNIKSNDLVEVCIHVRKFRATLDGLRKFRDSKTHAQDGKEQRFLTTGKR